MIIYGINVTMEKLEPFHQTATTEKEIVFESGPSRDWKPEPTGCNCGKPKKPKK